MTGPGCPTCEYRGTTLLIPGNRLSLIPCGACSPWTRPDGFPGAALRAKADAILVDPESASPAMREWAARLMDDVKEHE